MWWYRDKGKKARDGAPGARSAAPPSPAALLRQALGAAPGPDTALLAMALLVDHRLELVDGTSLGPASMRDAEKAVDEAFGGGSPMRLYNRYVREWGERSTLAPELPAEARAGLERVRLALLANGVRALHPRA